MVSILSPHNGKKLFCDVLIRSAAIPDSFSTNILMNEYRALFDTGATITNISQKVVRDLNLQSIRKVDVMYGGGPMRRPLHAFHMGMMDYSEGQAKPVMFERVFSGAQMLPDARFDFDVLLGMDFITQGKLTVSSNNFSFSI